MNGTYFEAYITYGWKLDNKPQVWRIAIYKYCFVLAFYFNNDS